MLSPWLTQRTRTVADPQTGSETLQLGTERVCDPSYTSLEEYITALRTAAEGLTDVRVELQEQFNGFDDGNSVTVCGWRDATAQEAADFAAFTADRLERASQEQERQAAQLRRERPELFTGSD